MTRRASPLETGAGFPEYAGNSTMRVAGALAVSALVFAAAKVAQHIKPIHRNLETKDDGWRNLVLPPEFVDEIRPAEDLPEEAA